MAWSLTIDTQRDAMDRITSIRLRLDAPEDTWVDATFTPTSRVSTIDCGGDSDPDADGWSEGTFRHLAWEEDCLSLGCRLRKSPTHRGMEREPMIFLGAKRAVIPRDFEGEVAVAISRVGNLWVAMQKQHRRRVHYTPTDSDPGGDPRVRVLMPWGRSFERRERLPLKRDPQCAYCLEPLLKDRPIVQWHGCSEATLPENAWRSGLVVEGLTPHMVSGGWHSGAYDVCADMDSCLARGHVEYPSGVAYLV